MEHMDRLYESPFAIPREDVGALLASEGLLLLRSCLARDADFCDFHAASDTQTRDTWLLHRDLLHALVMPVVELYRRASTLAGATLRTPKSEDLELAFAGEARGAFVWLQCFTTGEEADWCRTKGCPACTTTATLSTESHIRLTIAASLVSTASTASPPASPTPSASSSRASSPTAEPPLAPSLPPIPHILPALRAALAKDPFWGPAYWPYLLSRATQLSGGIQALIADCAALEAAGSAAGSPKVRGGAESRGVRLSKSALAERQLGLRGEGEAYMRRCAGQTWARAVLPRAVRGRILGGEEVGRRGSC